MSHWYKALDANGQRMAEQVAEMAARQAVFGFLSILDGSRQVETGGAKGHLELRYIDEGGPNVIGGPDGEVLHELL
jgi:hypothetical protein